MDTKKKFPFFFFFRILAPTKRTKRGKKNKKTDTTFSILSFRQKYFFPPSFLSLLFTIFLSFIFIYSRTTKALKRKGRRILFQKPSAAFVTLRPATKVTVTFISFCKTDTKLKQSTSKFSSTFKESRILHIFLTISSKIFN